MKVKMDPTCYFTVDRPWGPAETVAKGSRFITRLHPVDDAGQAATLLREVRDQYRDATHVCFAWRVRHGLETEERSSDDGEPSGTAGPPLLLELQRRCLFQVLGTVTRYFGGVKLGTGGLVRAYGGALRALLDSVRLLERPITRPLQLRIPFALTGAVLPLLDRYAVAIEAREFSPEGQNLRLQVPVQNFDPLARAIRDRTAGKISLVSN